MSQVLVVGGGLAGAAAATLLARAGLRPRLLEREAEPIDKVCGEFLSAGAQAHLARVGLDLDAMGAAPIARLRLAGPGRTIETALPFVARGVSRRRLDTALLDRATQAGAAVERGIAVRAIRDGRVETTAGDLAPETLLLASGKHDVRGAGRDAAGADTGFVGLKSHWRLPPPARVRLAGTIAVALFDGGYAGLQPIEDGLANLCVAVRKDRFAALGGWPGLFAVLRAIPTLGAILDDAEPLGDRPLAVAGVPYGFVRRHADAPGLFRLGDQAAVIPSFCGEGMAIALASGVGAAETIAAGGDAHAYHRRLHRAVARPIGLAMRLQRGGEAGVGRSALLAALGLAPALARAAIRATRVRQ